MTMTSHAARSLAVFPGGGNGEFNLPAELCTVLVRGEGCRVWTDAGHPMLDFSMGWGSALIGHGHRAIADAVSAQVRLGANFACVNEQSLILAEEIVRLSPACEAVRLCASGTEATMYCLRLARAFTNRPYVLKFEGAYHGAHDTGVASTFPPEPIDYPQAQSTSSGIEPGMEKNVLIAPFNDLETTRQIVNQNQERLAAIIVEPLQRCVPPTPGFLEGLRKLTQETRSLLIFDEVVTGFRLAYGGAQEYYGVIPDLVAYGKALGGGLPIGAFGGRREVMELVCEDRMHRQQYVWMASTFGGNPISSAAANAALAVYRQEDPYPKLLELGKYLRAQMRSVLKANKLEAQVIGDGPLAQFVLSSTEVRDYRTSRHGSPKLARQLVLELFARGVFLNPMGTKLYLSLAHDRAACDEFCTILEDSIASVL
jgi:glutamate-1-semialdehyde 2,1-aminomutase